MSTLSIGSGPNGPQRVILRRHLDTNGDGTGTKEAATSGATYYVQPGAGDIFRVSSLVVALEDATAFEPEKFAGAPALSTGLTVDIEKGGVVEVDLTDGVKITRNANLKALAGPDHFYEQAGTNNHLLIARIAIRSVFANDVRLDGDGTNERLRVVVGDDLSSLISVVFVAEGYLEG